MMDIWSWISELTESSESTLVFELAKSEPSKGNPTRSIQLKAERTSEWNSEDSLTFSLCLQGFNSFSSEKPLWVSDTCPLSSEKPFLPLLFQLLQEIIDRSPTAHNVTCPKSQLQKLKPNPVSWIMDSHSPESFSSFFDLVLLMRLFWLCVCDAPSEVGSVYFYSLLGPNLAALTCKHGPVLRAFFITVGVDTELCFMRTFGYMLAKWLILREMGVGLQTLAPLRSQRLGFSYAVEAHGLWTLKGYVPVSAMKLMRCSDEKSKFPIMEAKESVLRYALAHHQLEAVIQLEYKVAFHDGYIQVYARVDNLRFHVAKLGFNKNDDVDFADEKHFPSRIRVWVGPEIGAAYVSGLTLGRSTHNGEQEVEKQRIVKSSYGKTKAAQVKTRARVSTKAKMRNWRWEEDAEGNAAVFNAVLCDNVTGEEVGTWRRGSGGEGLRNRYRGGRRAFNEGGGVVFAGDEYGEGVGWRISREMEGSVLKWRVGGEVWLSYWPNNVRSCYFEMRSVEWCDEVDLPLIPGKQMG